MEKMSILDWVVLILVVVGGLNWALYGLMGTDLVATVLGPMSMLAKVVYGLIGLSALYMLVMAFMKGMK